MNKEDPMPFQAPEPDAPLTDCRVLDLSSPVGPYSTRLLADLGAEVTLIEPPGGDPYRHRGPFRSGIPRADAGLSFGYYHANKRSVVLDLDQSAARQRLESLAQTADVIVISPSASRPLWGFSVEDRRLEWAPSTAIVCSVTAYGVGGPYWHRPYTHLTSFAHSGQMAFAGAPQEAPTAMPAGIHWHNTSIHAVVAILAALEVRDRVGGQFLDISAQEVGAYQLAAISSYHAQGSIPGQRLSGSVVPPSGVWDCIDGRIDIAAYAERHWPAFLEMVGHPPELSEPALADMGVRRQIFDGITPIVQNIVADRRREELFELGQRAGLPVCLRNTPTEFVADAQLTQRDFWVDLGTPGAALPAPGAPVLSRPRLFCASAPAPRYNDDPGAADSAQRASEPSMSGDSPDGPLAGVRILSLGAFIAGNVCAQILAGLGAEVVKVEKRDRPEALRGPGYNDAPTLAVEPSGVTNTPMQAQFTRGLKNLGLDVSIPQGQRVFRSLARRCDIVIENFAGSVMADWHLSFDELVQVNPSLIFVSMSGYGRTGDRASYRAYASNIASFTGLTEAWWNSATFTDYVTAVHSALSAVAARRQVRNTGTAVFIDVAQTEAFAAMAAELYLEPLARRAGSAVEHQHDAVPSLTRVVRCSGNDRWAAIEIENGEQWDSACRAIGEPGLAGDGGCADQYDATALGAALETWAAPLTAHSAAHIMVRAGVPAAPVANAEDVYHDPQLRSRGFLQDVEHQDLGHLVMPTTPQRLSNPPTSLSVLPARLGEHSRDVLLRWGAFTDEEVDDLVESGAVFDGGPATSNTGIGMLR